MKNDQGPGKAYSMPHDSQIAGTDAYLTDAPSGEGRDARVLALLHGMTKDRALVALGLSSRGAIQKTFWVQIWEKFCAT